MPRIIKAGREAGDWGRDYESSMDAELLAQMESEGKLQTHVFADRDRILNLAAPVKEAYATEIGAADVYKAITEVQ